MGRPLATALLLACVLAPAARAAPDPFRAQRDSSDADLAARRDRARKARGAQAAALWYDLANHGRTPSPDYESLPLHLRDQLTKMNEKAARLKIWREALGHVDPLGLAALSAQWPDPEISAAMVRALRALKREDEAAAECRAALGRWSTGDVPVVVEACRDCRAGQYAVAAGPALHSVFRQWLIDPDGDSREYGRGVIRGLGKPEWASRVRISTTERDDPRIDGFLASREPFGVVIGDPGNPRGLRGATLAAAFRIPFVALGLNAVVRDSMRSAVMPGERALVPRPGPNALAALLLEAARKQGARKLALVVPTEGGDLRLAHALGRAAEAGGFPVATIEYPAGRREHREDMRQVRASGADAVALLGPGEESADWLPALRASAGAPLLVLGTDELDPAGFHELARRAVEGAIFVRTRYTPADSIAGGWTGPSASAWVAGWAVGSAIARGADSPRALLKALEAGTSETDASNAWLTIPPEIARIEVLRVKNGRAEILR
jgi:hypothetical protein